MLAGTWSASTSIAPRTGLIFPHWRQPHCRSATMGRGPEPSPPKIRDGQESHYPDDRRLSTPFVSCPFGLAGGMDDVDDRHGIGRLVYEIVDDVPHDGSGADALSIEFAYERKGVRVSLKSDRAIPDPGQPVGGSACPGLLGDVPRHLSQRFQRPRGEDNFISTHNSTPNSSATLRIASLAGTPGSPAL